MLPTYGVKKKYFIYVLTGIEIFEPLDWHWLKLRKQDWDCNGFHYINVSSVQIVTPE